MPRVDASVARAAISRLATAPLLMLVEEGDEIEPEALTRALDGDTVAEPAVLLVRRPDDDLARVLPQVNPSRRVRALLVVNVCAAAAYVSWWLRPGHVGSPILFALLAISEAFNLFHLLGLWWTVWTTKVVRPPRTVTATRSIDVFVTTCGEPLAMLERTLRAAVALEGAHRTFVLDDAGRPEVRRLAEDLGAEYLERPTRVGAKAGNLNHALSVTDGELVAVFDVDHVPHPDFLTRLVAYFEDDDLAFVQTPQFYANARHNPLARGAYQQQTIFYGPICRGKNGVNAAFCCGTNVVFRRAALTDIGGFDEQSVVEDFLTSMRLHRRGWRSVYYPAVLSEGLGPETLRQYSSQQFRWARGSIGALTSFEPFRRGYTLAQRLQYLLATTFYLMGLVTVVYVALPILYLLGGWSAFSSSSGDFALYYAPYLVLGLVTVRWGLGGRLRLEHLRYTFGAFPIYASAAVAAFVRLPARFKATGAARRTGVPSFALVTAAAFVLTAASIGIGLLTQPLDPRTYTNVSWALVNLTLLSGIAFATFKAFRTPAPAETVYAPSRPVRSLPEQALSTAAPRRHRVPSAGSTTARIVALTFFGFSLRLALAGVQSLRLDESLSLREAQLPLRTMVNNLFTWDVHPPLYYTLLHLWVDVAGTSVIALRFPSIVFGTAAIPLLYVVARRLTSERGATFAAAVGAAAPFWVWHSDEARMYSLLLALTLAALWRLFVACEQNTRRQWIVYGLVTAVSLYSHYFAVLMLPVHATWVLMQRPRRAIVMRWLVAVGSAVSVLCVWLALMVVHDGVAGVAAINTGVLSPAPAHGFLGGIYAIFLFLLVFVVGYGRGLGHGAGVLGTVGAILAGGWPVVAVAAVVSRRLGTWLRSRTALFLTFWIVFVVGTVYVLNLWKGNVWMQRYLIIVSPALFIPLGIGLARILRPLAVGTALVVTVLTIATVSENFDPGNQVSEDWRGVASELVTSSRPGDAVAVLPWFYTTPLAYYFHGSIQVRGTLSADETPAHTLQTLRTMAQSHRGHDLWVATAYEDVFDPNATIRTGLAHMLVPVHSYKLPGQIVLRRYYVPVTGPRRR